MVSRETIEALQLVTLVYLAIGAAFWCFVLIPTGVVPAAFARRAHVSLSFGLRASVAAILTWPLFAWVTWRRRKEVAARLRRAWGVRR